MNVNSLILKNLKKNIKNYYLYVFALVFGVALYFAFVTLQFDPALDQTKGDVKGAAAIKVSSYLLVIIVAVFLLYANTIFIKRRSKEIGLFQLIGMTKNRIFKLLTVENAILYFGSMVIGIFAGFSFSKLILMVLFKVTGVSSTAELRFSGDALLQTIIVFIGIYLLIMMMNAFFIKKQSILALFNVKSSTENSMKGMSIWEVIMGLCGIGLIAAGYYVSTRLFGGDFTSMTELFMAMAFILGSVIIGTYFFYKGSVSFIFNVIRKQQGGYLSINQVLSLSSIMFRMKSNSLLLTVITTVSALAIGLLSLTYISYYSADKTAISQTPNHFALQDENDLKIFEEALKQKEIPYDVTKIEVIQVNTDLSAIMKQKENEGFQMDTRNTQMAVISDKDVKGVNLSPGETILTGYSDMLSRFIPMKDSGRVVYKGKEHKEKKNYLSMEDNFYVSWKFTGGGFPIGIVDDAVFNKLKSDLDPSIQMETSLYLGLDVKETSQLKDANKLFNQTFNQETTQSISQLNSKEQQRSNMGIAMFCVAFLGLAFLVTSGCILYFKQMDESEDEKPNYTILRKLGYTRGDLLRGIQFKQLFNFGIPLMIGLLHSYFAVKSGWFFFGNDFWAPTLIVMGVYAVLYSIFGILSVLYYQKVIRDSLS
ncbi:ABC transporter permease [Rossellomorea marisflavi]|jgi:bacitracin transport system permease protein|uniref:ABC transporter permease n=1 Tax=Rossellomorea marisflavi TaxID=189381 RepID=UPI0028532E6D|nr:ABC transporter permease [Rossellomorea marisflavi]MDR4935050.1 ABC transporter permease [Rossellomorea marisflavi]